MQASQESGAGDGPPTVTVGVVTDPGIATKVATRVARGLPQELARAVGEDVRWRVETRCYPLTLDENEQIPVLRIGRQQRDQHGWDVAVLITDLPRRVADRPLVSDYGRSARTILVSLPALGAVGLVRRTRRILTYPVGPTDYAGVAWLAASPGTIAGALGSGLADPEDVLQATYSRREQQRRQLARERAEQDDG